MLCGFLCGVSAFVCGRLVFCLSSVSRWPLLDKLGSWPSTRNAKEMSSRQMLLNFAFLVLPSFMERWHERCLERRKVFCAPAPYICMCMCHAARKTVPPVAIVQNFQNGQSAHITIAQAVELVSEGLCPQDHSHGPFAAGCTLAAVSWHSETLQPGLALPGRMGLAARLPLSGLSSISYLPFVFSRICSSVWIALTLVEGIQPLRPFVVLLLVTLLSIPFYYFFHLFFFPAPCQWHF